MNPHAAIVLAAGGSQRLGRPKQLLTRDGETLVHRALRLAATTRPRHLLLVTGAYSRDVAAACADLPIRIVDNPAWRQGLGGSLRAAAQALASLDTQPRRCLLLACDQPALQAGHLLALLDAAARSPAQCALTDYGDACGIPAVVATALLAQAPDRDRGLRAILAALPENEVARVANAELALDVDTAEDLRAAIARGWVDAEDVRN
ncbi:nucleotidyltransferase family protein [Pseudoxanthomonas wuyuanensis]